MSLNINVDSRLLDRLNAACGIAMGAALILLLTMALQPSLNPPDDGGNLRIQLRGPSVGTELTAANTSAELKNMDAAAPES